MQKIFKLLLFLTLPSISMAQALDPHLVEALGKSTDLVLKRDIHISPTGIFGVIDGRYSFDGEGGYECSLIASTAPKRASLVKAETAEPFRVKSIYTSQYRSQKHTWIELGGNKDAIARIDCFTESEYDIALTLQMFLQIFDTVIELRAQPN
jgi:uncharacterized protein YjhX (UPF0386 family)